MTYTPTSNLLSGAARLLPPEAMDGFVKVANETLEQGFDHNECVRVAWEEVKKAYRRPDIGKVWVRKDEPGAGDVHVNAPLGGKAKKPKKETFETSSQVVKMDDNLGLVFGWAIVCTKGGQDYVDLQDDHIPEDSMLKAAADFMANSRVAKDMHAGDQIGDVVFAWPMTSEIAKSLDIETETTGLLIAMKPSADVYAKFKDGTYSGFSIGGRRIEDEEVA
ncbi:MAG: XkdF-like putative serine protease domain-containing protein [Rhodospirillales bacterium]|jgi:hypothetical protein